MKCLTPVTDGRSQIEIRPAEGAHAERLAQIWHQGWFDGHAGNVPPELVAHRTLAEFERRAAARVAETTIAADAGSGDIAGFVVVRHDEVEQLYVALGWRGRGVADQLLAHAEWVIAQRFPVAWLAVVAGNTRARRFYARREWVDRGPFDNPAETTDGTMLVPARRYEKNLAVTHGPIDREERTP